MKHICIICKNKLMFSELQSFEKLNSWYCPSPFNSKYSDTHFRFYSDKETDEFIYCQFYTKHFSGYWYKNFTGNMKDTVHIYHNIFPRGEGTQQPFLELKGKDIDFLDLDRYDKKWHLLSVFS